MIGDATLRAYERAFGPFVHMSQQEKAIWLRWLQKGGTVYAPFQYDVRVGSGLQMPPGSTIYSVKAAYALTTKRIDVVFMQNGIPVITEVKVRAGTTAVGELITYRDLYIKGDPGTPTPALLLITDSLQPDIAHVLEENGISWNIA
jgi:hypothetical protein